MTVNLEITRDGIVLPVLASPGARRSGLSGTHAGALRVAVTQAPEKGKANAAIIDVLACALSLKKSQLTLLSGETARQKKFLVTGVELDILRAAIEQALSGD